MATLLCWQVPTANSWLIQVSHPIPLQDQGRAWPPSAIIRSNTSSILIGTLTIHRLRHLAAYSSHVFIGSEQARLRQANCTFSFRLDNAQVRSVKRPCVLHINALPPCIRITHSRVSP